MTDDLSWFQFKANFHLGCIMYMSRVKVTAEMLLRWHTKRNTFEENKWLAFCFLNAGIIEYYAKQHSSQSFLCKHYKAKLNLGNHQLVN